MSALSVSELLKAALQHHQQGRLDLAEQGYGQVLALAPSNADAWHLLGVIALTRGQFQQAISSIQKAIELKPGQATFYSNLGTAFGAAKQYDKAIQSFQQAISLRPENIETYINLGILYKQSGQLEQAVELLRQVISRCPDSHQGHLNLGHALWSLGDTKGALQVYTQAVHLRPEDAESHFSLGVVYQAMEILEQARKSYQKAIELNRSYAMPHHNLGTLHEKQGEWERALACYDKALSLKPQYPQALFNKGNALNAMGEDEAAIRCFQQAIKVNPRYAQAYVSLGLVLEARKEIAKAIECYRQAIAMRPEFPEAMINLGNALKLLRQHQQAAEYYQRALALSPDFAGAHVNYGLLLLLQGDFEQGFREYEYRFQTGKQSPKPPFIQPEWDGSSLQGTTLFIYPEQGLGDTLQFVRYVPLLKEQGARVIFGCQRPLASLLLRSPGIDILVTHHDSRESFDWHVPLLAVPRLLGTTVESIPGSVPYVFPDPKKVQYWEQVLQTIDKLRVGIVWQGNPAHVNDRWRSIPLEEFGGLAELGNVQLISLQKVYGTEQLSHWSGPPILDVLADVEESGGFDELAAILMNLDLVVTCDTAVAHLAGSMGIPVWVVLSAAPDWRWLLNRSDSPWYPAVSLFRQEQLGDWTHPFRHMKEHLKAISEEHRGQHRPMPTPRDAYQLGIELYKAGKLTESLAQFEIHIASVPNDHKAYIAAGVVLERMGRISDAVELYRQAVQIHPTPDYYCAVGNTLKKLRGAGRATEEQAEYEAALRLDPDHITALLNLADVQLYLNNSEGAIETCEKILAINPESVEALRGLATIYFQQKAFSPAAEYCERALALQPENPDIHFKLGNIWKEDRQIERAADSFEQVVLRKPEHFQAWLHLGLMRFTLKQQDHGLSCYECAVALQPDEPKAHFGKGNALQALDRNEEAQVSFRRAIELKPEYPEAYCNLGVTYQALGEMEKAKEAYEQAIQLKPSLVVGWVNMGTLLLATRHPKEAILYLEHAKSLDDSNAEVYQHLATAYQLVGQMDKAICAVERALELTPESHQAWHTLGVIQNGRGEYEQAKACYTRALELSPDFKEAHLALAFHHLLLGKWELAWPDYRYRWDIVKEIKKPKLPGREWNGSPLGMRRLFVYSEQGLGDTIQFLRLLPLLKAQPGHVVFACQKALLSLVQRSPLTDQVVSKLALPPGVDFHVPLLDLPGLIGLTPETIPADIPYLFADPSRVARWEQYFASVSGMKVGILWQGNPEFPSDEHRSIPLAKFIPIADVKKAQLVNLQMLYGVDQLADWDGLEILDPTKQITKDEGLEELAAVMMNLDLIITCDTAIAHLAGALGVQVWLALSAAPDWRWLLNREDTPWYPTMRLFRQPKLGDWESVFERMAEKLSRITSVPLLLAKPGSQN